MTHAGRTPRRETAARKNRPPQRAERADLPTWDSGEEAQIEAQRAVVNALCGRGMSRSRISRYLGYSTQNSIDKLMSASGTPLRGRAADKLSKLGQKRADCYEMVRANLIAGIALVRLPDVQRLATWLEEGARLIAEMQPLMPSSHHYA